MFTFLAGVVAGALLMKYVSFGEQKDDDDPDDDGQIGSLLTPQQRRASKQNVTNSRATELNNSFANLYNEKLDCSEVSHVNFLSDVVARLWPYLSEALANTIREAIEPTFRDTLPGFLKSLKFKKFVMGDVPFVFDNLLVRELRQIDDAGKAYGKDQHYLQFEWDVTWQSTCDIQLATDQILGIAPISFGVKRFTVSGRLQVIAKPLNQVLPCIKAVQFAFVNPPKVELDFTGAANLADMKLNIGGFNVLDLNRMVRSDVNAILAQAMVLPNRIIVPLEDNLDYRDVFSPVYKGLARIRLHSGRGFEVQKKKFIGQKDDIPDVYVKIRLGVEKFFESSVCKDNCSPVWDPDENFHDFLFCSGRDQILEIQAWDRDSGALDSDDRLGRAYVTLGQALLKADRNGLFEVELMNKATSKGKNDTSTGHSITISLEKLPFTTKDLSSVLEPESDRRSSSNDGHSKMSARERKKQKRQDDIRIVGLATCVISHAVNLPFVKDEEANTFVKLSMAIGTERIEIGKTPTISNSRNPQYMTPFSFPLTHSYIKEYRESHDHKYFYFEIFQRDPNHTKPKSLGEIVVDHSEIKVGDEWSLREERNFGMDPLSNTKLAFTISFAGVSPSLVTRESLFGKGNSNSNSNSSGFGDSRTDFNTDLPSPVDLVSTREVVNESIEMVVNKIRVHIVKGYGFTTSEKGRFRKADIPDVYCMIKFGSSPTNWRTPTIKNSETPAWDDEYRDYVMESANEIISIDVWDENRRSNDDYYGNARTSIGNVLMNNGFLDIEIKNDGGKNQALLRNSKKGLGTMMFIRVQCQKL